MQQLWFGQHHQSEILEQFVLAQCLHVFFRRLEDPSFYILEELKNDETY